MSKVVAYLRVSTENQEAEGTSLDTQERGCLAKGQALAAPGDEVVALREVFSGLSLDRPELSRLRGWVRQGQVKAVVAYSCDRLARDGLHLLLLVEEFEKAGVSLTFITEPHQSSPEGQLLTFVRGWASKLEALKIKERTGRGLKERCRRGQLVGQGQLYGYLYIKGKGESRGVRVPDTEKAPLVADIFRRYAGGGVTLRGLRDSLATQDIAPPKGRGQWSLAELRRLLANRAYIGETTVRWRDGSEVIDVQGATPALVSRDLFEAAQERLRLNRELSKRRGKLDYPLRGMVFCAACGRRMVGGSRGEGRRFYGCPSHHRISAPELEGQVWEAAKGLLANPDLVRAQLAQHQEQGTAEDLEARLVAVSRRLASMDKGEEAILRALRRGEVAESLALGQLREGHREREALERGAASLRGQLQAARRTEHLDLDSLCANALAAFDRPTPGLQALALAALDARVEVGQDKATVHLSLPVPDEGAFVFQDLKPPPRPYR